MFAMFCVTTFMNCFVTLNYGQWEILEDWIDFPCFLFSLYIRLLQFYFLLVYFLSSFKVFLIMVLILPVMFFSFSWFSIFCFHFSYSCYYYHDLSSMNLLLCLLFNFKVSILSMFFILLLVMRNLVLLLLFFVLVTVQICSSSKHCVLNNGGDWYCTSSLILIKE